MEFLEVLDETALICHHRHPINDILFPKNRRETATRNPAFGYTGQSLAQSQSQDELEYRAD
jgi:hypothetical protein